MLKEMLWQEIELLPDSRLQAVLEFVRFLQDIEQKEPKAVPSRRIPGLDAGTTWVSDDFDEPLPDSSWLGDDSTHEAAA